MEWSVLLDEQYEKGVTLLHTGESFRIESLTLEPRIIQYENDATVKGLQIVVKVDDFEIARETQWGLGMGAVYGDPNSYPNKQFLEEVLSALAPEAVYQGHINIRAMQKQTEEYLKLIREAREKLSHVYLEYEGSRIKLSLGMAQQVLFIKWRDRARASIKPFRLQRESKSVAVVFNDQNRVMGRIGFNPTEERYRTTEGRFGLYNIPDMTQEGT
jgi:hypothetical protein